MRRTLLTKVQRVLPFAAAGARAFTAAPQAPQVAPLLRRARSCCTIMAMGPVTPAAVAVTHVSVQRWSSSAMSSATSAKETAHPTPEQSAVNVEEFTLNEEVVKRDLENLARWNALSAALDQARAARDYAALLTEVGRGLSLLEELGALNAPVQCESLLCMEASQAHFNRAEYAEARAYAERAQASLMEAKAESRDMAQIAEIKQFIGFILLREGKSEEALRVFEDVMHWIDVDAKTAMPIQAVAAVNLRRTVLSGLGQAMEQRANAEKAAGNAAEAKELYGKALDTLIDALNHHIDENDFQLVKSTLGRILECFEGVGDVEQAMTTCKKYVSWCRRHNDEAGVEHGKTMLATLCERHSLPVPNME